MPQLIWSPQALLDVHRLYRLLVLKHQDSVKRAVTAIRQGVKVLSLQPGMGRPVPELEPEFRDCINWGQIPIVCLFREPSGSLTASGLCFVKSQDNYRDIEEPEGGAPHCLSPWGRGFYILKPEATHLSAKIKSMRLTPAQINTIKSTATAVLGAGSQVTLFGSRVHDDQKGGDVDLYVETHQPELMKKIRCKVSLQDQLDMPVDLIAYSGERDRRFR